MFLIILILVSLATSQLSLLANVVYGQTDFTSALTVVPPTASTLYSTRGIIMDSKENLYIASGNGNRVLRYPPGSTTANLVYGQADFASSGANRNGNVAANTLSSPTRLAIDSQDRLYVSDSFNNRVLRFDFGQTTPTKVYGQADFTSNSFNRGGSSPSSVTLALPTGLALDRNDNLYISDSSNNRILRFANDSTTPNEVYGQPNFGSRTAASLPTKDNFGNSGMLHYDIQGFLWIADGTFNRVLRYSPTLKTSVFVYGQPDFTSRASSSTTGVTGNSYNGPTEVFTMGNASNIQVFISDHFNNRVLYYENLSTTPTQIFGQPTSTSNTANIGGRSQSSLFRPNGLYGNLKDGTKLFVCDGNNNRVLGYVDTTSTTTTPPSGNLTTAPGGGGNVCFHQETKMKFDSESKPFTLLDVQKGKIPECVVAHLVQSKGVKLVFDYNFTLRVTQNHLIVTDRTLFVKAHMVTKDHRIKCNSPKGWCTLQEMTWVDKVETYFGLNCLQSTVYADEIVASTFEHYHYIPSIWMKVAGHIFGIRKASSWGDSIAQWAHDNNLI